MKTLIAILACLCLTAGAQTTTNHWTAKPAGVTQPGVVVRVVPLGQPKAGSRQTVGPRPMVIITAYAQLIVPATNGFAAASASIDCTNHVSHTWGLTNGTWTSSPNLCQSGDTLTVTWCTNTVSPPTNCSPVLTVAKYSGGTWTDYPCVVPYWPISTPPVQQIVAPYSWSPSPLVESFGISYFATSCNSSTNTNQLNVIIKGK